MVRIIAGTLVEVGYGKREPDDIVDIINAKEREVAGVTAPSSGLYLMEVLLLGLCFLIMLSNMFESIYNSIFKPAKVDNLHFFLLKEKNEAKKVQDFPMWLYGNARGS